ncbi:MAG: hypothetical protein DRO39_04290 [Thermoprotei archaeon]|nr:MAG: hypothetical protein DRO39_04290 [Thermoprotei archaeon]
MITAVKIVEGALPCLAAPYHALRPLFLDTRIIDALELSVDRNQLLGKYSGKVGGCVEGVSRGEEVAALNLVIDVPVLIDRLFI